MWGDEPLMKEVFNTIFCWMPRAIWGDLIGHRNHDVRKIPGPYGFCNTCENVISWGRYERKAK